MCAAKLNNCFQLVLTTHTERAMNVQYSTKVNIFHYYSKKLASQKSVWKDCSLPSNILSLDLFTLLTTVIHSNRSAACVWSEEKEESGKEGVREEVGLCELVLETPNTSQMW